MIISKFFLVDVYCPFNMADYPFDYQSCEVILINKGNVDNIVELIQDTLVYSGPTDVLQYFIEQPFFVPSSDNSVIVKINLSRRIQNVILNTFLPTVLIILVRRMIVVTFIPYSCTNHKHFDV